MIWNRQLLAGVVVAALVLGCSQTEEVPEIQFAAQPGTEPSVRFEIRLAERTPREGLTEAPVMGREHKVYLHPDVALSNADVRSTSVSISQTAPPDGRPGPIIDVFFTVEGTRKFAETTEKSLRKPLAFLLDGKVVLAPIVLESIPGGQCLIAANFADLTEACKTAKGIVGN